MIRILLATMLFLGVAAQAQAQAFSSDAVFINEARIIEADRPEFAEPDFDDSGWTQTGVYEINPQDRLLWMRAYVDGGDLAPMSDEHPLGLFVMALASREVYFNGELVGASGVPGATPEEETPGALDAVYFLPEKLIVPGDNVIAVRISSHHLPVGVKSPFHGMIITAYQAPNAFPQQNYTPALFVGGAISLGAFYFLGLFAANRRDAASLALGVLALAVVGQLAAEAWRAFHLYPYPVHMTRLFLILGCAFAAGGALSAFAALTFAPHRLRLVLLTGGLLATLSLFLPGFDAKTGFVILSFVLSALAAAIVGIVNRRPGARFAALGFIAIIGAAIIDPWNFLDQNYYLLIVVLIMALFALQIRLLGAERRAREEAALTAVRLRHELLKKQIQPHFLMNTLTTLAEWIESEPATGARMIDALSGEMRLLYDISEKTLIPLEDELELCRRHLTVMSLRADAGFTLRVKAAPDSIQIPPAIILTLIENAFTHNEYRNDAEFEFAATVDGANVAVVFRAPIRRAVAATRSREGAGLAYVRARLTEAFGDHWTLESNAAGDVWETEVSWRTQ